MTTIDFQRIAAECLANADRLLPQWLPSGKKIGGHWVCGGVDQSEGSSLKISLSEGCWKDYGADPRKGGDLISLYAAIHGIDNGEAAKRLQDELRIDTAKPAPPRPKPAPAPSTIGKPPADAPEPELPGAALRWCYRDADGLPLHWVARYNNADGSKDIKPWCWDTAAGAWVCKGWPGKRPLYGLDLLAQRPGAPVLIVEGEKCADAMRGVDGCVYVVVTWSGGAKAVGKADLAPLHGRKVLIWPDADKAGHDAAEDIIKALRPHCPEIKVLDVVGQPDGWDCADAIKDGWDWAKIVAWAKPRAMVVDAQGLVPRSSPPVEVKPTAPTQPQPTAPAAEPETKIEDHVQTTRTDGEASCNWHDLGLVVGKKGVIPNLDNAERVLCAWEPLRGRIWLDEFSGRTWTNWDGPLREWSDGDDARLQLMMQRKIGISSMGADTVRQAVRVVADKNKRNGPKDWLETLKWDGIDRLDMWAIDLLGVEDTPYARAVSRCFILSMVARVYRPGCKVDTMVILEGKQGARKSTALSVLGGEWFGEVAAEVGSQKWLEQIQGLMLVEIAELDSFGKADATRIKQALSCAEDNFRPAYGRYVVKYPRRCVLSGSTNEDGYLKDSTGGRRFWPLRVGEINIDGLRAVRAHLFAEAVAKFKKGAPWWDVPMDDAQKEQELRRQSDTWEDIIAEWLPGCGGRTTIRTVLEQAIKLEPGRHDKASQHRVGHCLRALGWNSTGVEWLDGKAQRVWRPKPVQA